MTFSSMPGPAYGSPVGPPGTDAPLVLLFERDDTLAMPLLSQLRLAGYDVRAARTPVELFDAAQKHTVSLVVVDLGNAAASRREFWVALDAQRRGRAIQVLTFRVVMPGLPPESELDGAPQALADVEVGGPHETAPLVEAVHQRVPLGAGTAHGAAPTAGTPGMAGMSGVPGMGWPGDTTRPGASPASPFAHPAAGNPFAAADAPSPFDQPDTSNPFAQTQPPAPSNSYSPNPISSTPFAGAPGNPYAEPYGAMAGALPYTPPSAPFSAPGLDGSDYGASFARLPPMPPMPPMPDLPPMMPPGFAPASGPGQFAPWPDQPGGQPGALGHANGNTNSNGYAAPWGSPASPPGRTSYPGATNVPGMSALAPAPGPAPVMDAWLPPDGAALPTDPRAPAALPAAMPSGSSDAWPGEQTAARHSDGLNGAIGANGALQTGTVQEASRFLDAPFYPTFAESTAGVDAEPEVFSGEWSQAEHSTAPVDAWMPTPVPPPPPGGSPYAGGHDASGGLTLPEERALGAVLVEGALLSPQQLGVLKDIRRILNNVEVEYKLGELALLFRFLSPDQLLAALLVSRQLISPEQIAALGRIKQEMAASGMNYDLETLLVMFHIMSREDLDRLRAELA